MKRTLEIDEELYPEVKSRASLAGRPMKDLVNEGLRQVLSWVSQFATKWEGYRKLAVCFAEADKAMKTAPHAPIARDYLD